MAKRKAKESPPRKIGRPTKFHKDVPEQARKLCLLGATDAEMADFFGVSENTLNRWKKEHPEFRESITRGKLLADAEVAASLYHRAIGYSHKAVKILQYEGQPITVDYTEHYPPDTPAARAWLHNRQPTRWRSNPDVGEGADVPTPVQVTVNVVDGRRDAQSDA